MRTRLRDSPEDSASPSAKSRTVATRPRAAIDRIAAASETLPDPPFPVETRGHRQRSPPRNRRPQPAPRGSTRASSRRGPTHRQPEGRPRNSDDGARCHGSGLICPVPAGRGPSKARKPAIQRGPIGLRHIDALPDSDCFPCGASPLRGLAFRALRRVLGGRGDHHPELRESRHAATLSGWNGLRCRRRRHVDTGASSSPRALDCDK